LAPRGGGSGDSTLFSAIIFGDDEFVVSAGFFSCT
jgi:hypothetical protein